MLESPLPLPPQTNNTFIVSIARPRPVRHHSETHLQLQQLRLRSRSPSGKTTDASECLLTPSIKRWQPTSPLATSEPITISPSFWDQRTPSPEVQPPTRPSLRRLHTDSDMWSRTSSSMSMASSSGSSEESESDAATTLVSSSRHNSDETTVTLTNPLALVFEEVQTANDEPPIGQIYLRGGPIVSGHHRAFERFQEWQMEMAQHLTGIGTLKQWEIYISNPELKGFKTREVQAQPPERPTFPELPKTDPCCARCKHLAFECDGRARRRSFA